MILSLELRCDQRTVGHSLRTATSNCTSDTTSIACALECGLCPVIRLYVNASDPTNAASKWLFFSRHQDKSMGDFRDQLLARTFKFSAPVTEWTTLGYRRPIHLLYCAWLFLDIPNLKTTEGVVHPWKLAIHKNLHIMRVDFELLPWPINPVLRFAWV